MGVIKLQVFWALRLAIHYALGNECAECGRNEYLDIQHIHHDGGQIRKRWRLSGKPKNWEVLDAIGYYTDILYGVCKPELRKTPEVELLCRECHIKHHKQHGYEED